MNLQFFLYLEGIDNFFVNPFSSDVINPTKEEAKLTNHSTNELQVNWFSSWVVHSYVICRQPIVLTIHYNAGHNHVKKR